MQIFFPFACALTSLRCLDSKRLGKQRLEAYQVWTIVSGKEPNSKWRHHPIIKMWSGYEVALRDYIIKSVEVFGERKTKDGKRFFDNTCMLEFIEEHDMRLKPDEKVVYPDFIGNATFHDSHKAMLYHKGREAVRVMALKGKTIDNIYEQFASYSHITSYYWPVELKTTKMLTAEQPTRVKTEKRKREGEEEPKRARRKLNSVTTSVNNDNNVVVDSAEVVMKAAAIALRVK